MKKITKCYVTYMSPGSFVSNTWNVDIPLGCDHNDIDWPDNAYAFSIHERTDVVDGDAIFTGEPIQIGPLYYHPDSKAETLAQVKRNPKATRTLITNMESNRWSKVVWTRFGGVQTFGPETEILR